MGREQLGLAVDVGALERDVLLRQIGKSGEGLEIALQVGEVCANAGELALRLLPQRRQLPVRAGLLAVVYDVFLDDKKVLVIDVKSFSPEM